MTGPRRETTTVDDLSMVEVLTPVSRVVRNDPFRWERHVEHQRRRLRALIPDDRHSVGDVSYAVVEYPAEPAKPSEKIYRFVLHHAA
jgi:hypothetical protein